MGKLKAFIFGVYRDDRGITGMETAIILIAFLVVASVFTYTVLSAGVFSTQSGEQAVYIGLEETRSALEIKGNTIVKSDGTSCTQMIFNISSALSGVPINFTPPNDVDANGLADSDSTNVVTIAYNSENKYTDNIAWNMSGVGKDDGDYMLEAGEVFQINVNLTGVGESVGRLKTFTVEIKPHRGAVLKVERTAPNSLDSIMILR